MKVTCFLRVAKGARGYTFAATGKPSKAPLSTSAGQALPTRQFKLVLDIPATAFDPVDGEVHIAVSDAVLGDIIRADAEAA